MPLRIDSPGCERYNLIGIGANYLDPLPHHPACGSAPGRFEKLRSCESGNAEAVEVGPREHAGYLQQTAVPPALAHPRHQRGQLMGSTETSQATIDRGRTPPVLELDGSESAAQPRIEVLERLGGLRETEVGLPPRHVGPQLFRNLSHAATTDTAGDEPDALLERDECLGSYRNFDRISRPPPQAVAQELTPKDGTYRGLRLVHPKVKLCVQAPQGAEHSLTSFLTAHVHVAVVGVASETLAPLFQCLVHFIEQHIG